MIKVAFWFDRPQAYSGGLNYLRNLLYALSRQEPRVIDPYIFFGHGVDDRVEADFTPLATVVRTSVLDRKGLAWFAHRILHTFFGSLLAIHVVLRRHGIGIVSHADRLHGARRPFKIISWIPDFQYLHLPALFPRSPEGETQRLLKIARQTDALVLSSHAALADYRSVAGDAAADVVTVLPFVSQPAHRDDRAAPTLTDAESRFDFEGPFFFLPNQFWQHKNHAVVFEAVKLLRDRGVDILMLCTGNLRDYRVTTTGYAEELARFVDVNGLCRHIRILGMVDYTDVLLLMRNCVAVLNPSRFEGWSSTVEEARSLGKPLILSDIPVHREQDPPLAAYFDPDDATALADLLAAAWRHRHRADAGDAAAAAAADLDKRTREFADRYSRLVAAL